MLKIPYLFKSAHTFTFIFISVKYQSLQRVSTMPQSTLDKFSRKNNLFGYHIWDRGDLNRHSFILKINLGFFFSRWIQFDIFFLIILKLIFLCFFLFVMDLKFLQHFPYLIHILVWSLIFSRSGLSQGLLYKHLRDQLIQSVSQPFPPTALRRHHAQTVRHNTSSYKKDYFIIIKTFSSPIGIKTPLVVQKLRPFYWRGRFCLLVELHWDGSAPAACAAGLFDYCVKY